jgi:hypothetical protein
MVTDGYKERKQQKTFSVFSAGPGDNGRIKKLMFIILQPLGVVKTVLGDELGLRQADPHIPHRLRYNLTERNEVSMAVTSASFITCCRYFLNEISSNIRQETFAKFDEISWQNYCEIFNIFFSKILALIMELYCISVAVTSLFPRHSLGNFKKHPKVQY